jgi:NTP pyrophosphatase (non-canonical NTP hydrolase)
VNPRYAPKTRKKKLVRVVEEIGEVLQWFGKAERFGLATRFCYNRMRVVRDKKVESNREGLRRELRDLRDACSIAIKELE